MVPERFDFPNAAGHLLAARLERPPQEPLAYALFAHCFTCGKDNLAAKRIAEALTARGIAVLRFDFTGLGASEGDFANTHFSSNVADVVAAADHLRKTRRAPALLIGHSLGGAAVLAAAAAVPETRAVVTIAAPSDPGHVTGLFRDRVEAIRPGRDGGALSRCDQAGGWRRSRAARRAGHGDRRRPVPAGHRHGPAWDRRRRAAGGRRARQRPQPLRSAARRAGRMHRHDASPLCRP